MNSAIRAKRASLRALAALMLAGFATAGLAQTKWDMAVGYPANNFHTENLQQMADDVERATGGKLKIVLHPNGSLFKANEIKRAVQGGQAQIGEVLMSILSNENPVFGVDSIPFLASSYPDARRLWQASRPVLERILNEQELVLRYAVPWPPQGIYVNKSLDTAADMKGLKWRAYNPATSRIAQLVGAQPVTIQAAELAQALATGTVNSFISSSATGVDTKVWENLSYFYTVDAWIPKNMVIVNKKAYDALDKTTQIALDKALADAEKRGWQLSQKKNSGFLAELEKNGMKVQKPSWRLKKDLNQVGQTMINEWLNKAVSVGSSDGKKILDDYYKTVGK